MDQLIKIKINEKSEQTVSGRDLHDFLGVKDKYSQWFNRMSDYGFIEGFDFIPILGKSSGGRPKQNHQLKVGMAKEISMIQRTERGKLTRQYFIDCEGRLKQNLPMSLDEKIATIASGYGNMRQEIGNVKEKVEDLSERFGLPATNAAILSNVRNGHIVHYLGGKDTRAYQKLSRKVFSEFGRDFKENFEVPLVTMRFH
ncbi:antA/AntB antirepressor family protein [Lactococcus lactis]|uniref:antA/AntB antirepressor family protein n=1 Tax=Lactococcus lactis TaxID=1358 RepID=UPI00223AE057|nr:antA/AntB antirepressor family protein [Lactococcus lactis]